MAERNVLAFIMAYGYISDLSTADKERHVEKVRDFTKKDYDNSLDPSQDWGLPFLLYCVRSFAELVLLYGVGLLNEFVLRFQGGAGWRECDFERRRKATEHVNSAAGIIVLNIYVNVK